MKIIPSIMLSLFGVMVILSGCNSKEPKPLKIETYKEDPNDAKVISVGKDLFLIKMRNQIKTISRMNQDNTKDNFVYIYRGLMNE